MICEEGLLETVGESCSTMLPRAGSRREGRFGGMGGGGGDAGTIGQESPVEEDTEEEADSTAGDLVNELVREEGPKIDLSEATLASIGSLSSMGEGEATVICEGVISAGEGVPSSETGG